MDFVDDVDAVLSAKGRELHVLANLPHVVDAGIGGAVDLHHIDGGALCDFEAVDAGVAGVAGWSLFAVQRLGQNAGDRGFADSAGAGKEIGMRNAFRVDRIHQRLNDVRLADHIIERAGSVFSGGDLIIHDR